MIPVYEYSGKHRKLTYEFEAPETVRTYLFPGGDRIEITDVVSTMVSRHGNHHLTTTDGTVHVIAWGWLSLTFSKPSKVTLKEVNERGS